MTDPRSQAIIDRLTVLQRELRSAKADCLLLADRFKNKHRPDFILPFFLQLESGFGPIKTRLNNFRAHHDEELPPEPPLADARGEDSE